MICWTNEEGARFSPPMMGSMAFRPEAHRSQRAGDHGRQRRDGRRGLGRHRLCRAGAARRASLRCVYRAHIEQAPVLDRERCDVGIVVAATGPRRCADHRGRIPATPAARRWPCGATRWPARLRHRGGQRYRAGLPADEGRTTTTRIRVPQPARHLCRAGQADDRFPPCRSRALRGHAGRRRRRSWRRRSGAMSRSRSTRAGAGARSVRARDHRPVEDDRDELGLPYREMRSPGRPRRLRGRDPGADRDDLPRPAPTVSATTSRKTSSSRARSRRPICCSRRGRRANR